jgi:hypothetical protein
MKKALRLVGFAIAILMCPPLFGRDASPEQAPARHQSTTAPKITTPKQFFGFDMGADYCLANYQQLSAYWQKLSGESDRIKIVEIGRTAEDRPQRMAIVTSPANHKQLDKFKDIARRMAQADGVDVVEASRLAAEGKAVIWIDAGLHATESLCAQALIETIYRFLQADDAETMRILNDVVILFVHANPDGHDLVADWYMREQDPKKRTFNGLPRLYQKYVGHDDNRDFYANTQAETKNLNKVLYREWFPQIMYNHHQTGPAGTVLFIPPFRDPFNYNIDPLVTNGIDSVGAAMMERFLVEGKPGATCRSGAPYSTWFNGGLRTTSGFHNMIGILTETIGGPTPTTIPFLPAKQLPKGDYLAPIAPQVWHFRQSVEYSVTANRAILDYASRNRERLLRNIWLMGKNAIERGNRDYWTITPKIVEAATAATRNASARAAAGQVRGARGGAGGRRGGGSGTADFAKLFHDPAKRDPRGYILSANQPDFLTATKFVNALLGTGVQVLKAKAPFEVAGKKYPAGSYVVKTGQAFRAHVLDMFEPQDHPNDIPYPGAAPTRPYDSAGYTLAFQMGFQFDRVLEGFTGPFEEIKEIVATPPGGQVAIVEGAAGYFLSTRPNDAFKAVNRLLKAGVKVERLKVPFDAAGKTHEAGEFFIPLQANTVEILKKVAGEVGTSFHGSPVAPGAKAQPIGPVRIGLWDRYGGSMPSGWTRWILEQFEFPFKRVYAPELDRGDLINNYDVLVFVDGAISARSGRGGRGGIRGAVPAGAGGGDQADGQGGAESNLPAEYRGQRGNITSATTIPQLKKFMEAGGTVITIGGSTSLHRELGLPISNHLVEVADSGEERPLPAEKYYVPASVLRVRIDTTSSLALGMDDHADVMFSNSPTFRIGSKAKKDMLQKVAWFDSKTPLRSGWAWGEKYLEGGVTIVDAKVGQGRLVLFGPEVLFRGQPHGTFKLFFNGLVQSGRAETKAASLQRGSASSGE